MHWVVKRNCILQSLPKGKNDKNDKNDDFEGWGHSGKRQPWLCLLLHLKFHQCWGSARSGYIRAQPSTMAHGSATNILYLVYPPCITISWQCVHRRQCQKCRISAQFVARNRRLLSMTGKPQQSQGADHGDTPSLKRVQHFFGMPLW